MKDLPTRYWLEDTTSNLDLEEKLKDRVRNLHHQKLAIVTIHDVCPEYISKIVLIVKELDKLGIPYNIAIIPLYKGKRKNDIRKDKSLVKLLLGNRKETALHGFYHEKKGKIEKFDDLTKKQAKNTLIQALTFFKKAGIKNTKIFIPPTWAVNKQAIEVLESLKFKIIETEEEIILLNKKKRLLSTVLNWDLGSLKTDVKYHTLIKQLFSRQVKFGCNLVRLAIHPKDPAGILEEQCNMIAKLLKKGYKFVQYSQLSDEF